MKKIIIIIILFSHVSITFSKEIAKEPVKKDDYVKFSNQKFNFKLLLPKKWEKDEIDLNYTFVMVLSNINNAEIKVYAASVDDAENDKWNSYSDWYAEGIGNNLKVILEKKKITIGADIDSKLIILEYMQQNTKILKRILINRYKNIIIVIECGSSVQSFYSYEKTFNAVMSSLEIHK